METVNNFLHLDNHVRNAWVTKKFSDGTILDLSNGANEQGFIVKTDGIFEIKIKNQKVYNCKDGREIVATTFNLNSFMGYAGGHTHPRGVEKYPGPVDGNIAKNRFNDGKISYVITYKGAYAVEWTGTTFIIRNLIGFKISDKKIQSLINKWTKNKPRKRQQSMRDFVCQ